MTAQEQVRMKNFFEPLDFYEMAAKRWTGEEGDDLVWGCPWNAIIENFGVEFRTEEHLAVAVDHFFTEMRKDHPNSILVCEL